MYSFVCTTPNPYFHSLLHPCQGIKYPSAVDINIHPGSSISNQFWFSLLSVIRPQALCGASLCILAEKTLQEGICGLGSLRWKELAPFWCDTVTVFADRMQPGRVHDWSCCQSRCNNQKGHRISSLGRRLQQSGASWSKSLAEQASPEAKRFSSTGQKLFLLLKWPHSLT